MAAVPQTKRYYNPRTVSPFCAIPRGKLRVDVHSLVMMALHAEYCGVISSMALRMGTRMVCYLITMLVTAQLLGSRICIRRFLIVPNPLNGHGFPTVLAISLVQVAICLLLVPNVWYKNVSR